MDFLYPLDLVAYTNASCVSLVPQGLIRPMVEPPGLKSTLIHTPTLSLPGPSRPPFQPIIHPANHVSSLAGPNEQWVEPLSTQCHFSLSRFLSVLKDLSLHPERNSSLILRADPLPPRDPYVEQVNDLEKFEEIGIRLMPKQPKRDGKLDQRCVFFRTSETGHERGREEGLVLMIPEVKEVGDIPFYHPPVRKLAFRYESISALPDVTPSTDEQEPPVKGSISIAYLPFDPPPLATPTLHPLIPSPPGGRSRPSRKRSPLAGPPLGQGENATGPTPPPAVILAPGGTIPEDEAAKRDTAITEERLHRTCLGLLERVYKYGYGEVIGYRKRVAHDVGLILKQAIATILMSCDRSSFPATPSKTSTSPSKTATVTSSPAFQK